MNRKIRAHKTLAIIISDMKFNVFNSLTIKKSKIMTQVLFE